MDTRIRRLIRRGLALAAAALGLGVSIPVNAILQVDLFVDSSASDFHSVFVDNGAGDTDPSADRIYFGSTINPIPNFIIADGYFSSNFAGLNILNAGVSTVTNGTEGDVRIRIAVSDTDFGPVATTAEFISSGGFYNAVGSTFLLEFYNDPTNTQGANSLSGALAPGNLVHSLSGQASSDPDGYSIYTAKPVFDPSLYSMTLLVDVTLHGGGVWDGHTQIMEKTIPEPPSLALFGLGLAGLGAMRRKKLAA